MQLLSENIPVLLYDGQCFLCTQSAKIIVRLDKKYKIKFSPLQSNKTIELLEIYHLPKPSMETLLLLYNGKLYQKSNAVFEVFKIVGGGWKLFLIFKFVPLFIRDKIYDFVSNNRYNWFGKLDSCDFGLFGKERML